MTATEQIDRALTEVLNRPAGNEPPAPQNNRGSEKMLGALNNLAYDPLYGGTPKQPADEPKPPKPETEKVE